MKIERTKNTIKGSLWGVLNQMAIILFPFIARTCILYIFGAKYVGLGSLFTSVLSVLSLAELGVGSAIVYSMYEPIANDDNDKICALIKLYKDVYRIIGFVVLGIGILLIPFLKYLINDSIPNEINIYVLYLMYLANSVVSYWVFAYKSCLLTAFQRNDVLTRISLELRVLFFILQMLVVCLMRDYYLYILLMPILSVSTNIMIARYVDKYYPQYSPKGKLDDIEIKQIKKQVAGLITQRLAYTSRNALDNIIISAYVSLTAVAVYGNYFLIINGMTGILAVLFTSMQAGIGNSVVKESLEKNHEDFLNINFIYLWIACFCSITYAVLVQPFMELWVGADLMFPAYIVFLFAIYFFIMKMTDTVGAYIAAIGLWWQCKWIYLAETLTNLILNVVLGYYLGILGIIIATIVSVLIVNYLFTARCLYKNYFSNKSFSKYLSGNLLYLGLFTINLLVSYILINFLYSRIGLTNNLGFEILIKGIMCLFIPNIVFALFHFMSKRFKISVGWVNSKFIGR